MLYKGEPCTGMGSRRYLWAWDDIKTTASSEIVRHMYILEGLKLNPILLNDTRNNRRNLMNARHTRRLLLFSQYNMN
jgi:hypothetical protein